MDYFVLKSVCMPSDWMRAICCSVPTEKALGMVSANDVRCVCDVPCYTSALRDGWAVRSSDNGQTRTAAAWSVENGRSHAQLEVGQAIWVNTGGTVPQGADAVIASRNSMDLQKIQSCVVPGDNIEQQGSDWKRGEVIVPAGTRVGAREMALLFEAGVKRVAGWASPRVAVVATGSEITQEADGLSSGFRRCSNASYIAALMSRIGVTDIRTIVVPDDIRQLTRTLVELDAVCDVIITVGGTGKGKRDYTRQAVSDAGGVFVGHDTQLDSPFVTARLPHAGLIGLPGNPLAVMMIVQCVLLESVRSVFHLPEAPAQTVEAVMTEDIEAGICGELCVNVNESAAKPLIKGTGRMRVFDSARGFVRLNGQGIKRGERVRVELFRN